MVRILLTLSPYCRLTVLVLQFNLDRRDRCRREYVLIEEEDGVKIMEILKPILEQNESTLSMGNKLEVYSELPLIWAPEMRPPLARGLMLC